MSRESEIKELEASIQRANVHVELGNVLNKLMLNKEFRTIVLNGYFKDEAVRLVHLRSDPAVQSPEKQASILKQIDAIATFSSYLQLIQMQASMAQSSASEAQEEIADILSGDD